MNYLPGPFDVRSQEKWESAVGQPGSGEKWIVISSHGTLEKLIESNGKDFRSFKSFGLL